MEAFGLQLNTRCDWLLFLWYCAGYISSANKQCCSLHKDSLSDSLRWRMLSIHSWSRGKGAAISPRHLLVTAEKQVGYVRDLQISWELLVPACADIVGALRLSKDELLAMVGSDGWVSWIIKTVFTLLLRDRKSEGKQEIMILATCLSTRRIVNRSVWFSDTPSVISRLAISRIWIAEIHMRFVRDLERLWINWKHTFGVEPLAK
jgi:hypothetical protein